MLRRGRALLAGDHRDTVDEKVIGVFFEDGEADVAAAAREEPHLAALDPGVIILLGGTRDEACQRQIGGDVGAGADLSDDGQVAALGPSNRTERERSVRR
jgi:hypothetical protein